MNRGDRRDLTEKVAWSRKKSLGEGGESQPVGWFRKWNMTDRCPCCLIERAEERREVKAERRAGREQEKKF